MKKKETIEYLKACLDELREKIRVENQNNEEINHKFSKLYETQIKVAKIEIHRLNIILNNYEVKLGITARKNK